MWILEIEQEPTFQDGYLYWRARNIGDEPAPVNTSMGDYDIHDRGTHAPVVSARRSPISEDLHPGASEGYTIDLERLTPNDGHYTLVLKVDDDERMVDYDVHIGKVSPVP
jgi:hypothetical protein